MSDLVGKPEDRFSHNEAHIKFTGYNVQVCHINASSISLRCMTQLRGQLFEINDVVS